MLSHWLPLGSPNLMPQPPGTSRARATSKRHKGDRPHRALRPHISACAPRAPGGLGSEHVVPFLPTPMLETGLGSRRHEPWWFGQRPSVSLDGGPLPVPQEASSRGVAQCALAAPTREARTPARLRTLPPVPVSTSSPCAACSPFQDGEEQSNSGRQFRRRLPATRQRAAPARIPARSPAGHQGLPRHARPHAASAPTAPGHQGSRSQRDTCQVKVTAPSQLRLPRLHLQSASQPWTQSAGKARAAGPGRRPTARPRGHAQDGRV